MNWYTTNVYTNVYCPLNALSGRQLVNLGEKILQLHASGDSQTDGRGKTSTQKKLNKEISIIFFLNTLSRDKQSYSKSSIA